MGGAVPIEEIGIGDLVLTVSGEYRPVRWMGRRSYGALFARQNPAVWPVRICAGAISDQVPARDLFISPNHALLLEGVFIEAGLLVNGVSIQTAEPSEDISYINIELDSHDAIFAEGLAAETFLDRDCRSQFQNAAEYATLYPDAIPDPDPIFYARRVEDGATLAHVRDSIEIRAGIRSNTQTTRGPLKGAIDVADHSATSGWVVDVDAPASPVTLEILVNGAPVATVVANRHRADLVNQGDGSGRCSFRFEWPEPLDASVRNIVEVRRLEDAAPLKGPVVIEPTQTASLIPGLREALEEVRLSAERAQLDGTTALLQEAIEQLLQADADAVRKERSSRFWAGSDAEIYKRLVA